MKIAIVGASGFIGSALTLNLLESTDFHLVLFSHRASKLQFSAADEKRLHHVDGNILKQQDITKALKHCDLVVYLVHLFGNADVGTEFLESEKLAANNLAAALKANSIDRVIYVGGMGDGGRSLTRHLHSRLMTGEILRSKVGQLIEFRTPMVVGAGGAGYEVLRSIVRKFPILPVPKWAKAVTQPITVQDVVRYIVEAIKLADKSHLIIEIGGPEQLAYVQVAQRYARSIHTRLLIVPLPFCSQNTVAKFLRLFKNNPHAVTVADMIESAGYSTIIKDSTAKQLMPMIKPEPIENAFSDDS